MTWRDNAACGRTNLPWTRPLRATAVELEAMLRACRDCPVHTQCAADMRVRGDNVDVVRAGTVWSWTGKPVPTPRCADCGRRFIRTTTNRTCLSCSVRRSWVRRKRRVRL